MINQLNPYIACKDSGVEWLGKVLEHWEVRRIKTLFLETHERKGDSGVLLLPLTRTRGIVSQSKAANKSLVLKIFQTTKSVSPETWS